MTPGGERIARAIFAAKEAGRPAIAAYLTAGFPSREAFPALLLDVASAADVIEVGVPFSDPIADGVTIQTASRVALAAGTTLVWTLETLAAARTALAAPVVVMSYVNPLFVYGLAPLARDAAAAGVSGFLVPDLPLEEQAWLSPALRERGLALIQMTTPATPPHRLSHIAASSDGFLYAVTVAGITGGRLAGSSDLVDHLERVRAATAGPVLAGFGIRNADDVAAIVPPADGVVVGSALIAAIEKGAAPSHFLRGLRP
jgi:tryptophan synthase alpha chain